jgi:hypothetical protein
MLPLYAYLHPGNSSRELGVKMLLHQAVEPKLPNQDT